MAFLRKRRIGDGTYLYIIETRRVSGKVRHKILEYLGRNPPSQRVAKALEYWGITKPKQAAVQKPRMEKLIVHALGGAPVPALVDKVDWVPLQDCALCSEHVKKYRAKCIGHECGSTVVADLVTPHRGGGRVYCGTCYTRTADNYNEVRRGKAQQPPVYPGWVTREPNQIHTSAQWPEGPEDWKWWHEQALIMIARSGRISTDLFTQPLTPDGGPVLRAMDRRFDDWDQHVISHLLAGVGCEYMLKALYILHGYSLRKPTTHKPVAKRGTKEAQWYNPYHCVSFGPLIARKNLEQLGADALKYRGLDLAKLWRDEPAHIPKAGSQNAGVFVMRLGACLRVLHHELMQAADDEHRHKVTTILADTMPVEFKRRVTGGDQTDEA